MPPHVVDEHLVVKVLHKVRLFCSEGDEVGLLKDSGLAAAANFVDSAGGRLCELL